MSSDWHTFPADPLPPSLGNGPPPYWGDDSFFFPCELAEEDRVSEVVVAAPTGVNWRCTPFLICRSPASYSVKGNNKCPDAEASSGSVRVPGGGVNCILPGPHKCSFRLTMSKMPRLRDRLVSPQRGNITVRDDGRLIPRWTHRAFQGLERSRHAGHLLRPLCFLPDSFNSNDIGERLSRGFNSLFLRYLLHAFHPPSSHEIVEGSGVDQQTFSAVFQPGRL